MEFGYELNYWYWIICFFGEGGMVNVYLVYDLVLDWDVLVKLLWFDLWDDFNMQCCFYCEVLVVI